MTPSRRLSRLSDALCRRIDRLQAIFSARPFHGAPSDADRVVAYCIVELANGWSQFVRCYYLSCAIGTRQRCGARVHHAGTFRGYDDALIQSSTIMGKSIRGKTPTPFEEPDWSAPGTLITISQKLSFTNLLEITNAFAITRSIFQPLNICRNFYAHRSKTTADKIEDLSRRLSIIPTYRCATPLVCSVPPGKGLTMFELWCVLIQGIVFALAA
jgi:hypothetical protein